MILAVDDEPCVHDSFRVILEEQFDILDACDGQAALDIVRGQPVDVVLLDLLMPGISGLTLLERLLGIKRNLQVILVTAVVDPRTVVAAMKLGARDYLGKPFDADELIATVHSALSGRSSARNEAASAIILGPEIGVRTCLSVVLSGRHGLSVEPLAPVELYRFSSESSSAVCVDLSSFDRGVVGLVRSGQWLDIPLRRPFDFTGLLREATTFLPLRRPCPRWPHDLTGRVMERVAVDYAGASVDRLASDLGMSAGHLSRTFRDETGMTAKEFIRRVRLAVARWLLLDGDYKHAAIARHVGFFDAAHFSRVFHKFFGVPPGSYRSSASREASAAGS